MFFYFLYISRPLCSSRSAWSAFLRWNPGSRPRSNILFLPSAATCPAEGDDHVVAATLASHRHHQQHRVSKCSVGWKTEPDSPSGLWSLGWLPFIILDAQKPVCGRAATKIPADRRALCRQAACDYLGGFCASLIFFVVKIPWMNKTLESFISFETNCNQG